MKIDHDKQFACRQWLKIQILPASKLVTVDIDGVDDQMNDFLLDTILKSLYDRTYLALNITNQHLKIP